MGCTVLHSVQHDKIDGLKRKSCEFFNPGNQGSDNLTPGFRNNKWVQIHLRW